MVMYNILQVARSVFAKHESLQLIVNPSQHRNHSQTPFFHGPPADRGQGYQLFGAFLPEGLTSHRNYHSRHLYREIIPGGTHPRSGESFELQYQISSNG